MCRFFYADCCAYLEVARHSTPMPLRFSYFPSYSLQYFGPYVSADMHKMAVAFNTTVPALEDELMQLILDGQINARIDSHNKVSI